MPLVYKMTYTHPQDDRSGITMIPFDPAYKEQYKKIYNECYHEMREALDIKPYDFVRDDSFFAKGMDGVFLLSEEDEIIGSVALKDNEIDDLIVNPLYQGRGYGRKMLLWALENIGSEDIVLHVAEWNRKAVCLYKKTGFEITKTIKI